MKQYKYLGAVITMDISEELKNRIQNASQCLWTTINSKIQNSIKNIEVYKTIIKAVITYGSETWMLTKQNKNKLMIFVVKI